MSELTLLVVLRPASGAPPPAGGLTSATLAAGVPDPQDAARVREYLAGRGFELGPLVGISFSITGTRELARDVFGKVPTAGAVSLKRLPANVRRHVLAIETEAPPDFGPSSF
jgi:hypothetical protein